MLDLSGVQLREKFINKELTCEAITKAFIERAKNEQYGSLLSVLEKRAIEKAKQVDAKLKNGKTVGKLAAIPIIVKDNIMMKGEICTCGSVFLEEYTASFDATVVQEIDKEDGIIIAKSNMDEFAMGSSTSKSAFKLGVNPWKENYTPGGSSGGSAIAASVLAPITLGSDTGGSVRQPASFCGVYGLKPTYGRVSRNGLIAFASSLDQIGPFARNIKDLALIQSVIAAPCKKDSTSIQEKQENYFSALDGDIKGKKIGVPFHMLDGLNPEVQKSLDTFLETVKKLGAEIIDISLPNNKYSVPVYYIIAPAEASTNLARFDGIRYTKRSKEAKTLTDTYCLSRSEGFGEEVKRRILLGTYVLSAGFKDAYYKKAQKVRNKICDDYKEAFKKCDAICFPTCPDVAFEHGSITDPLTMYKQDIFTISANMTGVPAISVPAGITENGLPIGMQIQAPQMKDQVVFNIAKAFEDKHNFHKLRPTTKNEAGKK